MHFQHQDSLNPLTLLPTRQQLQSFLQNQGVNPEQLKSMTAWEQVQLARAYYDQQDSNQLSNSSRSTRLKVEPCA